MGAIQNILGNKNRDVDSIHKILDSHISGNDISWEESCQRLVHIGVQREEAMMLLAYEKSKIKYGYEISSETLTHLFDLARERAESVPLLHQFESLFFIIKTCWLYEHTPYFLFLDKGSDDLDDFIIKFSRQYADEFQDQEISINSWQKVNNPRRVRAVTFWENKIIDPLLMLDRIRKEGIEGLELSIDFHPFNYTRLLPEELSPEKRERIKKGIKKSGLKVDIHSPIVGPYSPHPDPKKGKQLFFDPLKCFHLHVEVIKLAKDIGAESVVIHLVDNSNPEKTAALVKKAEGTNVRVTLENYCHTTHVQNADFFISAIDEVLGVLPKDVRAKNFGITLDVGHYNIEGQDPLIAAEKIGTYCRTNDIFIRMHATDNYGELLFNPPAYSADVHGNVSGHGINNSAVIKLLRSMGHGIDVAAEQIQPLNPEDISIIHNAQTFHMETSYEGYIRKGRDFLSSAGPEALIGPEITHESAYRFLAGIEGVAALREHLIYRKIQDRKYLTVDEVKKASQEFMKVPRKLKKDMIKYVDDLLLPIQSETGTIQKNELDLICQNISGALFGTINNEHLNRFFSHTRTYNMGDLICEQDTAGQEMYFIKEGKVEVLINGNKLAELGAGEIFGEISLFYNVKRTATIKAGLDKTKIGVLTRKGFETLLQESQPHSYELIYRLYRILPERMRNLNDKYKTAINALDYILNIDKNELHRLESKNTQMRPITDPPLSVSEEDVLTVFRDIKSYETDQVIFSEGDSADGAYYILEGRVKVETFSPRYEEIMLGELDQGEIFGEMALIDNKPRSASVSAITPCRLAYIDKRGFNELIENRSELSFKLMACICLSLFWRILRLDRLYARIKETFQ